MIFFGSEILAQSDFFRSLKDAEIFLGCEKRQRDFFGLRKKVVIFLVDNSEVIYNSKRFEPR